MADPAKPATAGAGPTVLRAYKSRMEAVRAARRAVMAVQRKDISGRQIPSAENTWWGALNIVTGWVDHVQDTDSDHHAHILMASGPAQVGGVPATALRPTHRRHRGGPAEHRGP